MDNQHRKITGYRELGDEEIDLMNQLKAVEEALKAPLAAIEMANKGDDPEANRWVAIARKHLETGFMFALKAVARPSNGLGRK